MNQTSRHEVRFDYVNQAWIIDGEVQDCGHPAAMDCSCYGRSHAGELATPDMIRQV